MAIRYLRRPPKPRASSRSDKRVPSPEGGIPPVSAVSAEPLACLSCGRVHPATDLCEAQARVAEIEAAGGNVRP